MFKLIAQLNEVEVTSQQAIWDVKSRITREFPEATVVEKKNSATITGKGWRVELSRQLKDAFDVSVYKEKGFLKKEWVLIDSKFTDGISSTAQFIIKSLK